MYIYIHSPISTLLHNMTNPNFNFTTQHNESRSHLKGTILHYTTFSTSQNDIYMYIYIHTHTHTHIEWSWYHTHTEWRGYLKRTMLSWRRRSASSACICNNSHATIHMQHCHTHLSVTNHFQSPMVHIYESPTISSLQWYTSTSHELLPVSSNNTHATPSYTSMSHTLLDTHLWSTHCFQSPTVHIYQSRTISSLQWYTSMSHELLPVSSNVHLWVTHYLIHIHESPTVSLETQRYIYESHTTWYASTNHPLFPVSNGTLISVTHYVIHIYESRTISSH